ncbi:hypothetical protein [Paraburkholderia bryophila]|uniref:Uncharacterized protein n=1 Tax=Paraburkholderia bryophila TaxID=420952 RepID=A0A7Y9W3X1_9BURK|nr:hypothetical protein [Paraburkholderia bryophila]NYH13275.1 hypothetical protein [Paraburkholderia bryophila]NYH24167.1 hypothetical protein [Paraburkholderia bryophila]
MGSAVELDQTGRLTEAASATEMLPSSAAQTLRILAVGDSHTCVWDGEDRLLGVGISRSKMFAGLDMLHLGPVPSNPPEKLLFIASHPTVGSVE